MNKTQIRAIQEDMIKTLAALEEKYNVKFTNAGGTIGTTEATLKIKVMEISETAQEQREKEEREEFELYASLFGFKKTDYKRKVKLDGEVFTLVALNPNRPKNCCSITREDGKQFKCPKETLLHNWM